MLSAGLCLSSWFSESLPDVMQANLRMSCRRTFTWTPREFQLRTICANFCSEFLLMCLNGENAWQDGKGLFYAVDQSPVTRHRQALGWHSTCTIPCKPCSNKHSLQARAADSDGSLAALSRGLPRQPTRSQTSRRGHGAAHPGSPGSARGTSLHS